MFVDRVLRNSTKWGFAKRVSESRVFFFNERARDAFNRVVELDEMDLMIDVNHMPKSCTICMRDMIIFYGVEPVDNAPNQKRLYISPLPSISHKDMEVYVKCNADTYFDVLIDGGNIVEKSITRAIMGHPDTKPVTGEKDAPQLMFDLVVLNELMRCMADKFDVAVRPAINRNNKTAERLKNRPQCAHTVFTYTDGTQVNFRL